MTKNIRSANADGMINVSLVYNDGDICAMKCDACGKFIKKSWERWYCPHCQISFLEGVDYDDMKGVEVMLDLIKLCEDYDCN